MSRTSSRNGPYKIVEWVPGNYIKSVKNPDYWDAANVKIDEVYYYVQDDLAAAFSRYRAGEYDILTDLPGDQQQFVKDTMPGEGHFTPFLGVYYYVHQPGEGAVRQSRTCARPCRWRSTAT